MPYFPVDDKAHSHRKFIRAGAHAIGLWTFCGSWSNDQGTDGFVPDYIVQRFDPKWKSLAARLVEVGLWEVTEVKDERGWQFHEWEGSPTARRNYTRAEVEEKRRLNAERQQRNRARQGGTPRNVTRDVTRDTSVTSGVTNGHVTSDTSVSVRPPSHTHPKPLSSKPVTTLSGPLTKQDHAEGSTEEPTDERPPTSVDTGAPARWLKPAIELPTFRKGGTA